MRFAIATSDGYKCVLETFLRAEWSLEKLFISPGDWLCGNEQVIARAMALGVEIQCSPLSQNDLADLNRRGCQALVVASYNWKIPQWEPYLKYAVNFHPSPLPEGRGPYPLVRAILEGRPDWAVTCHRINEKFDYGEILDAEAFSLDPDECHESLRLKSQMAAARLAGRLCNSFESIWQTARPQDTGSYWRKWTEQDRNIDFVRPVHDIMRQIRAFGDIECLARINDLTIFVHRASGWLESHAARPGAVVHTSDLAIVVAAVGGYVAITEWSFTAPGAISSKPVALRR